MRNGEQQNDQRADFESNWSNRRSYYDAAGHIPQGVVVPGFLIVQKNGVVRMNKNYKGEPYGPASSLVNMF